MTMKKTLFVLALAALLLSSCETDLSRLSRAAPGSMTVDLGDGRGAQPWDGGLLPKAPKGTVAAYRVSIELRLDGAEFPDGPCLVIGPSSFPYRLSVNGRLVHRYGRPDDRDRIRMFSSTMVHLPADLLSASNLVEIEAWIGAERSPVMELGLVDATEGASYVFWRNFLMSQLVAGGFIVGIILLVYFLFITLLGRGKDLRLLWFALTCGAFALAYVNMVFNHQGLSDTLITKISRVGFFLCVVMMTFYIMETTGLLARKRWIKLAELGLVAAGSLWVVVQKDFISANDAFHLAMQFIITPNLLLCMALLGIAVARQGIRPYAILALGFAGIIVTSLYDMGYESTGRMPYAWTLVYGYEWMVVCVFLELAVKQERVSRVAQLQAGELSRKNDILRSVFRHVKAGSDTLSASSEDLAVSTREISVTGNQQAAAVREMVSTMEDADTLLGRISQKSSSVNQESKATAQKAEEGVSKVKQALVKLEAVIDRIAQSISLMNNLNEQLGSITEIVKLIEGIATQIRIIAFNASLEAVAAGDAGRNFRIVAEEVKRLSDSTMSSVKNIRERVNGLLSTSDNMVQVARQDYMALEQSWDLASGIGDTLAGITAEAESSAQAAADIDESIGEETSAFRQIVQTLKEISSGVNNFVDSANHTSETTERLNGIAEQLHGLIGQYSKEFMEEGDGA